MNKKQGAQIQFYPKEGSRKTKIDSSLVTQHYDIGWQSCH